MRQDNSLSLFNYICLFILCGIVISMWTREKRLEKRVVFLEEQIQRFDKFINDN